MQKNLFLHPSDLSMMPPRDQMQLW
uniref:Uncharacterized protein n=1 Tax=Arundo donax TaxID=35708 RepID=A0A0A9E340_ARUDO